MLRQVLDIWDQTRYVYRECWVQSTDDDGHIYGDVRFYNRLGEQKTVRVMKDWFNNRGRQFLRDNFEEIANYLNPTDGFTHVLARKFYRICTESDSEVSGTDEETSAAVAPMTHMAVGLSSSITDEKTSAARGLCNMKQSAPSASLSAAVSVKHNKATVQTQPAARVFPDPPPYVYHPSNLHKHIVRKPREQEPEQYFEPEDELEPEPWQSSSPVGKPYTGNTDSE